uniref:Branched-chain-amino-acid aminotransferase, mitochondrial n=1 Tax=Sphaerodactylus townsendi TaxID=933632 RepID=A0ACB8EVZ6_9SAUR
MFVGYTLTEAVCLLSLGYAKRRLGPLCLFLIILGSAPAFQVWKGNSSGAVVSFLGPQRFLSTSFKASDLQTELTSRPKPKPDSGSLVFGKNFTDHMLTVEWSQENGWREPQVRPFQNLVMHPASSALHYSVQLFEGMKAFRGPDKQIRLFRPMLNMERMLRTALRTCLPPFDKSELLECIRQLIRVDQDWVPHSDSASLYIRPTFIGTEPSLGVAKPSHALLFVILGPVGPYFATGSFNPVSLLADPRYIRAWMGGVGDYKIGGNYGPTIYVQNEASKQDCQQVLWLYGDDHQLTEVGTMNIFMFWKNQQGGNSEFEEKVITMAELIRGHRRRTGSRRVFSSGRGPASSRPLNRPSTRTNTTSPHHGKADRLLCETVSEGTDRYSVRPRCQ